RRRFVVNAAASYTTTERPCTHDHGILIFLYLSVSTRCSNSAAALRVRMGRGRPWAVLLLYALLPAMMLDAAARVDVNVGVVLDMGTLVGKMCWASIVVAAEDFYAAHPNYTTKLALHPRDARADVVGAGSAALGLLKNNGLLAILGPQKSSQARFLSGMANETQIPIISFTATSPSLSSSAEPYFVRAALNDSSQLNAIASVVKAFGWREVVAIYEDTDYGVGIVPYLIDALQEVNVRVPHRSVISPSATDAQIMEELYKLMTMQTRVFIVHMSPPMGIPLFYKAKAAGMVSNGYAWIMTDGIGSLVDSIDPAVIGTMQGFLGVKPYIPRTPEVAAFTLRWKSKYRSQNPGAEKAEPSIFSLWAYDAVRALAMAVERVGAKNFSFQRPEIGGNSTDLDAMAVSTAGPEVLRAVRETTFAGLGGEFRLVNGELQGSVYQIVNVAGSGHRIVGYWTPAYGISRRAKPGAPGKEYSASKEDLAGVVWPGDAIVVPRGWDIPTSGKKLRVAVPVKRGFFELVKVEADPTTKEPTPRGYCIDIFDKVMASLPFSVPYEYVPYVLHSGGSSTAYDELVKQVSIGKKFDAVAGDLTILAERLQYVDFTMPYTESGVFMIVRLKEGKQRSAWVFLKPLTVELWLASFGGFLLTGFVVCVIEYLGGNERFQGSLIKVGGNVMYFTFSTLVFAHRENLKSSLSKAVVIVWVFVVLILSSSYTASLSSRLTVEQLQPSVADMDQLMRSGDRVGYSAGSFIYGLLRQSFSNSRLVPLTGADEYAAALSNGTVAAIFHELPYIKLFLKKYCTGYTVIGRPTTRTSGFGFVKVNVWMMVFPKDSPLLPDVSAAVLRVTQGPDMDDIERKWMENDSTCKAQDDLTLPSATRLTFHSLRGLFLITAVTSISALLIAIVFPKNLPLISNVTAAVLKVTQGSEMDDHIERKWMENNSTCQGQDHGVVPSATRLTLYSLCGLFLITAVTPVLALLLAFAG
ncbi:hypothetical protein Taro_047079, partial [Colocasia esculenta]|nr:hypothetical protein [Colocasia esculenta]